MRDNSTLLELTEPRQAAVQTVIRIARKIDGRHELTISSGEAVAFRLRSAEIAWSFRYWASGEPSVRGVVAL